jgi:hypothetical protein
VTTLDPPRDPFSSPGHSLISNLAICCLSPLSYNQMHLQVPGLGIISLGDGTILLLLQDWGLNSAVQLLGSCSAT